jgi:ABC-2 type transport system ATP-binding protein
MDVQINSVIKTYGDYTSLDNINLSIPSGSIFGLLGPNGAVKTSLIRILNQITAPDSGSIHLGGKPLAPSDVSRIGYLPEERGLYKKMEVGEQSLYLCQLKGLSASDARRSLKEWFEKFGIQDWWGKKVEELSKGMAQKVQFITTVLHKPELLIFDEPFSGFDPINAELIKNEILELNKQGTTVIFSTHRMESVEELCDHIGLISRSRIVLDGNLSDIRNTFRDNTFDIQMQTPVESIQLPDDFECVSEEKKGTDLFLKVRLKSLDTSKLLVKLMEQGNVTSLSESIPSVNEIFIRTVKESHE